MVSVQVISHKNALTKFLLGFLVFLVILSGVSAFSTKTAEAKWVKEKPFDQSVLNLYCNALTSYGGLNKGAQNFGGTVADWYCVVTSSKKIWITPGNACKYKYGDVYKFRTTDFNKPLGGKCAIWQ